MAEKFVNENNTKTLLTETKDYVDRGLNSKQDTLTAGQNITIDANNVISASGGDDTKTYLETTSQIGIGNAYNTLPNIEIYNNNNIDMSLQVRGSQTRSIKLFASSQATPYIEFKSGNRAVQLISPTTSQNAFIYIPSQSGTLALTSDIPTDFTAAEVNSESATSGQVLTADGNGGTSWQNASGGTSLYRHILTISSRTSVNAVSQTLTCKVILDSTRQSTYTQAALSDEFMPTSSSTRVEIPICSNPITVATGGSNVFLQLNKLQPYKAGTDNKLTIYIWKTTMTTDGTSITTSQTTSEEWVTSLTDKVTQIL